ncbi:flavin-containing monooxygenase [Loktanella sp. DJP18]|uniref:flavin-containing monooxygenase n=1 Tax=Loktanella sp. DJP18 TaxID=3409788 RepID=UPI003BB6000A
MKAIVIGAGPAGLAVAACLAEAGVTVEMLERSARVGSRWRLHYDRLRLHTVRGRSGLPMLPMPRGTGRYPRRDEVVRYLEDYAAHFDLHPRFGCAVTKVTRDGNRWRVLHDQGETTADSVIFATGMADLPNLPHWTQDFTGEVLHSSAYRNPDRFRGRRVLVVGFGNSGGDIALDLAELRVDVAMSVRGPVNILPRELLGMPITSFGLLSRLLGPGLADRLTAPILRLAVGRPADYALVAAAKGPARQVSEDGRIPLIDMGTLGAIRAGLIAVRPGVSGVTGQHITFTDGTEADFDAVVAATGYRTDLRAMLGDHPALDAEGHPRMSGAGPDGLHFISYHAAADGQLRRIGIEAREIAKAIAG